MLARRQSEPHMKRIGNAPSLRRIVPLVAYVIAIAAGLKYGYEFGAQISGTILGVVLAINGAVFCSIVVGILVERAERTFSRRADDQRAPGG
jgi:uncharacterized membrane protein (DUF485 family)